MLNIEEYNKLIKEYKLPRIDDIPDLELYMDQIIIYVKKYFSIFPYSNESNFITPTMINNYVKNGLIPAPKGKKYTRRHVAYILAIFFLKQIFSLEEVKAFIYRIVQKQNERESYEAFCIIFEDELKKCADNNYKPPQNNKEDSPLIPIAISIANKLYSQFLIIEQIKK